MKRQWSDLELEMDGSLNHFEPLPKTANEYRTHVVHWYQDLACTIDYLETRDDIDRDNLAHFGSSRCS